MKAIVSFFSKVNTAVTVAILSVLFALPASVGAQGLLDPDDNIDLVTNSGGNITLRQAIRNIVNYLLGFLGLIAVVMIIYAGILMVTAGGNDDQVSKAKKILTWAAIGLIVILLSYAIVSALSSALSGAQPV